MGAEAKPVAESFGSLRRGLRWIRGLRAGRFEPVDWAWMFLLALASLALYLRTVAPGLLEGDEGEFQVNIFRLGVSHTGYPLFFLLGKLWTLLVPVGTIATRANLFSAFWGVLAVLAAYVIVRFLTRNPWAGALCGLLLAASRVEWSQAVIPRVYTMNSLFVIVLIFLFLLWRIGKVDLSVPVFAFGLSLTNHRTMMWFGPAIAIFVLWHERDKLFQPRRLATLAIAFILPLFLYAYVFWRGESDVGVEFHWKDFNDEILGGYVRASWRFGPVGWLISRVTDLYIPMLTEQFTALGMVAGLIGAAALLLDRPPRGWPRALPPREAFLFISLANLANTAFCVIFWVIDIDKFFLPSFITFLVLSGVGIAVLWEWVSKRPWVLVTRMAVVLAFLFATGFLIVKNWPLNDWSGRTDIARNWDENLSQALEQNAVIAGSWESLTPLEYAMYVDGRRRDLERWKVIVNNYQLGQVPYDSRQSDIERAVRAGRPVYLTLYPGDTETLGALVDEFLLTQVGNLWRVANMPPTNTDALTTFKTVQPLTAFSDQEGRSIQLLGYTVTPTSTLRAGDFAVVSLYWRLPEPTSARFGISLRIQDSQGHVILQRDSEPASGRRPTSGWLTNEVVQDDAGIIIPPDTPPGPLHLQLAVYESGTGKPLTPETGGLYALGDWELAPAAGSPSQDLLNIPHRLDQAFSSLRLLGYGLGPAGLRGGDSLDLSLWWQLALVNSTEAKITISLRNDSGVRTMLYAGAPIADYPPSRWRPGQILRGRYRLTLPIDWVGKSHLSVESGGRSTEIAEIQVQTSGRTLKVPSITHLQSARLGDSMQLLGYDLDKSKARPGETVRLTLYWQAVQRPARSYIVFTHALDQSGAVRGQEDSVPRGGSLPTDRWLPGEVVVDPYDIVIASDAAPGSYEFEVGMYLAETGVRVPAYASSGEREPDDRIVLNTNIEVR